MVCAKSRRIENGELSYSGNTFIRIRSGKHDSSSAHTHAYGMKELFDSSNLPERPILVPSTDGAQDEAPCYPKLLATAIYFFKHLKLDVFLHGVNTAGLSAFNPGERRMSPLSHDISGVVFSHKNFGRHLDSEGNTIDVKLEKNNFFHASQVLADIWAHTVLDGDKVNCTALQWEKSLRYQKCLHLGPQDMSSSHAMHFR